MDDAVKRVLDGYPDGVRKQLLTLRELVYEVAAETEGVGPLEETLKWGQVSFLNPAGTTLRMDTTRDDPDQVALYVHCQTSVVETLRFRYDDVLEFEGNRAIHVPADGGPAGIVRDCIRTILTYRLRSR